MRGLFDLVDLQDFNRQVAEGLKPEDPVNHIEVVVASQRTKLSFVARPNPERRGDAAYHGIHPRISHKTIQDFLLLGAARDAEAFWHGVQRLAAQDPRWWPGSLEGKPCNMDIGVKSPGSTPDTLEVDFLGRALLRMASRFGWKLACSAGAEALEACFAHYPEIYPRRDSSYAFRHDGQHVTLLGFADARAQDLLDEHFRLHVTPDGTLRLAPADETGYLPSLLWDWTAAKQVSDGLAGAIRGGFALQHGSIYYSGVMTRMEEIKLDNDHPESHDVEYVICRVGRTTYATVDAFDNPDILNHPYFSHGDPDDTVAVRQLAFDRHEDEVQAAHLYGSPRTYPNQSAFEHGRVEEINEYLKNSWNSHTIAVSGNLETRDGHLLIGRRAAGSIDGGTLYCSVNGQTEFRDPHVDFYYDSVYEDYPTMEFHSNLRVDFTEELSRECQAELGFATFRANWDYLGMSFLGRNNGDATPSQIANRRMHFNVLAHNRLDTTFEEIQESHLQATESFENHSIEGLRILPYDTRRDLALARLHKVVDWGSKNLDLIATITLLGTIVASAATKKNAPTVDLHPRTVAVILSLALLFKFAGWFKRRHMRRLVRHAVLVKSHLPGESMIHVILRRASRARSGATDQVHAIGQIMIPLHALARFAAQVPLPNPSAQQRQGAAP
ncbi:hypothetical protein GCM10027418_09200 [Mariniluteicoccus endophyticus]